MNYNLFSLSNVFWFDITCFGKRPHFTVFWYNFCTGVWMVLVVIITNRFKQLNWLWGEDVYLKHSVNTFWIQRFCRNNRTNALNKL